MRLCFERGVKFTKATAPSSPRALSLFSQDPFWDPPADIFIGSVYVYLQSLAYQIDIDETMSITNYQGKRVSGGVCVGGCWGSGLSEEWWLMSSPLPPPPSPLSDWGSVWNHFRPSFYQTFYGFIFPTTYSQMY